MILDMNYTIISGNKLVVNGVSPAIRIDDINFGTEENPLIWASNNPFYKPKLIKKLN